MGGFMAIRGFLGRLMAVSIVAGVLVPVLGSATPAFAMCADTGKHVYTFTGNNGVSWIGTNVYSAWTQGPNTIHYTTTSTATASASVTASVSVSVSDLITTAKADFGYSITTGTSYSNSWSYDIPIPNGVKARARVYKKGWQLQINDKVIQADCSSKHYQYLYLYGPISSNDNANYCIVRDSYPGTKYLNNGCVNH